MPKLTIEINNHDTWQSPNRILTTKDGKLYAAPNEGTPSPAASPYTHQRAEYHTKNGIKRFVGFLSNNEGSEKTLFELEV